MARRTAKEGGRLEKHREPYLLLLSRAALDEQQVVREAQAVLVCAFHVVPGGATTLVPPGRATTRAVHNVLEVGFDRGGRQVVDKGEEQKVLRRHVLPSLGEPRVPPAVEGSRRCKGGRQEALYLRLVHRGAVAAFAFALRLEQLVQSLQRRPAGLWWTTRGGRLAWRRARGHVRRRGRRRERDR